MNLGVVELARKSPLIICADRCATRSGTRFRLHGGTKLSKGSSLTLCTGKKNYNIFAAKRCLQMSTMDSGSTSNQRAHISIWYILGRKKSYSYMETRFEGLSIYNM